MEQKENVVIPDIGGASGVDVIELLVKAGDRVDLETPLVTLESDKATMEIPSPQAGIVSSLALQVGDKVSEGDLILVLTTTEDAKATDTAKAAPAASEEPATPPPTADAQPAVAPPVKPQAVVPEKTEAVSEQGNDDVSAGPAARRLARTLGVNLADIPGSGRKDRISKEDVEAFVKQRMTTGAGSSSAAGFSLPQGKVIDFSKFGETETKPMSKIKRFTGVNVHQSWVGIPQVTQFDQADITDLEAFRKAELGRAEADGYKLTMVAFVTKVVSQALAKFPQFNSSLDANGEQLIYKKYCNIGIAAETPNGLVVPVIKGVDQKSVAEIAKDLGQLSSKARDKGLTPAEMSGGCFTISSLGGIGGTAFTPIVNAPEVAILGLSRASMQPVYQNGQFVPRLILPLALTYDHRVIDGAEAARFTRYLSEHLSDIRRILL
ncbi:MAG: dihydrolipoyllysine-residue acetyltransferase [Gammaproteobacteria bacterium]|nr:dihydrolipoyllysine-residue acetyltransferase [Gammaproteobacteria bacterium]